MLKDVQKLCCKLPQGYRIQKITLTLELFEAAEENYRDKKILRVLVLPLQAFVATNMKLKERAGIISRNCEKSNDGNPEKR